MFAKHLGLSRVQAPLLETPGERGGGGDGGAHGAGSTAGALHDDGGDDDGGAGGEGDEGAGEARRAAEELDDRTPDEREQDELIDRLEPEERVKRLRTWARRGSRNWKKAAPYLEVFRGRGGALPTPDEIRRQLADAQDMAELNAFFAEHPDVLQTVLERKNGKGKGKKAEEDDAPFQDPFADVSKLPFDATDDAGRFFVDQFRGLAKTNHELRQELRRLNGQVTGVAQSTQNDRLAADEVQWKDQTLSAAKSSNLDDRETRQFVANVYADFRLARLEGRKVNPRDVIRRHLAFFAPLAASRTRRAAGDTGRRVQTTRDVRPPHRQGAAATAQTKDGKRETLKDARDSFFTRAGRTVPVR